MHYKHTQISYMMIIITIALLGFFIGNHIIASLEAKSVDSGANFLVTMTMLLTVIIIASFTYLTVSIDDKYLKIKFGYGIYQKKFLLDDIVSVKSVKNHWFCGWGIRFCFWPRKIIIYNISGFDAIEIELKNGKIYRIGTDEAYKLEQELLKAIKN